MTEAERLIRLRIQESGAIGIDEFMSIVMTHYYHHAHSFGKSGDFITAPEISQMFGEILGLWCANFWMEQGKPSFNLIEIGPGKGTLMADILHATKKINGFHEAMQQIYMVETSSTLIEVQKKKLGSYKKCIWVDHINKITNGFNIIVANEFFDALPIKQFIKKGGGFFEVKVGFFENRWAFIESDERFDFGVDCEEGAVLEILPAAQQYTLAIADKLKAGGAALIIDYGYIKPGLKSTLQVVKSHKYHNVFKDVGEADITAHVDFETLKNIFLQNGFEAVVSTQRDFLIENGIKLRAEQLIKAGADPIAINNDLERLISPKQMGELFKVLCVKNYKQKS